MTERGRRRRRRRSLFFWKHELLLVENLFTQTIEERLLSGKTIKAIRTIRGIVGRFPEYGIVDLFRMYSPRDIFWSVVAFSKLQHHALECDDKYNKGLDHERTTTSRLKLNGSTQFNIEELARYYPFASAAYGWKGLAFCGRLWLPSGGNYCVLARSTGINRQDIVTSNWHLRANLPAYYIARDTKRRALVLSIRGSLSPRNILTDLCVSCKDF
jgi:hypothetical protein